MSEQDQAAAAAREKLAQIQALLEGVDRFKDAGDGRHAREIVRALMEFHGMAVERLLERIAEREGGQAVIDSLAGDEVISSLLLLYGLHPLPVEARVEQALASMRGELAAGGAEVELAGVFGNVARLKMAGSCKERLREKLEEAIVERAPEVASIEVAQEVRVGAEGVGVKVGLPILS
jgi:hypothetical protein